MDWRYICACLRRLRGFFVPPLCASASDHAARTAFSPSWEYAHALHLTVWTPATTDPHFSPYLSAFPHPGITSRMPDHGARRIAIRIWSRMATYGHVKYTALAPVFPGCQALCGSGSPDLGQRGGIEPPFVPAAGFEPASAKDGRPRPWPQPPSATPACQVHTSMGNFGSGGGRISDGRPARA